MRDLPKRLRSSVCALVLAASLALSFAWVAAQQASPDGISLDPDDIGGVVTGPKGPEAGVWVIAETSDLPTRFAKIVVTDDRGRYVLPDLPRASYQVWVRGYGLVDSKRAQAKPGQRLNLAAVVAPDAKAAAQYYPADYWLALMDGSDPQLVSTLKNSCLICHQIGDRATREIPAALGTFKSSLEAWDHRVRVGPSGPAMSGVFNRLGDSRKRFAQWTDRIAAGAVPPTAPPRPAGIERQLVVTLWDWGTPTSFSHTHAATDRRTSTVNPNGRIYIPDAAHDLLLWADPVEHSAGQLPIPTRDPLPPARPVAVPSPYWGGGVVWDAVGVPRSAAMDEQGRVWFASRIRGADNQPAFCKEGSSNKFARYFPLNRSGKQAVVFDPRTEKMTLIDTCFTTDHNFFADAPDSPLYFGQAYGDEGTVGWISTSVYDKGNNEEAAQGWCPQVLDTNGDGTITRGWTEPNDPVDPSKDHRVTFGCYAVAASPADGSAWCTGFSGAAGLQPSAKQQIGRLERGSNPPETCKAELYVAPPGIEVEGGIDVDSNGVVWANWRGTDHLTSFDRRKCKTLNGPTATGAHCPEGWTVYRHAARAFQGSTLNADVNYLMAVDRHNTVGLGRDAPILYAVNADALVMLRPGTGQFVTLRVPYPMGFYTRNAHGRIDEATAGWKGRGLWSSYMPYTVWHLEGAPGTMGGKGQKGKVVKFQFRPDPLAK
jgi:hypothetical protein